MTKTTPYYSPGQNIDCDTDFTVEKERDLFTRFYAGGDDALEARDTLIKQYLKLVLQLSVRNARGRVTTEEAISAGNLALIEALESRRFEIGRVRFSTFLGHYIRGRVAREAREFPKIEQEPTRLRSRDDQETEINYSEEIADEKALEAMDLAEFREIVSPLLGLLTENERYYIDAFYFKGISLWEAARKQPNNLGGPVSRAWASKLHASAMKKFRRALRHTENPFK